MSSLQVNGDPVDGVGYRLEIVRHYDCIREMDRTVGRIRSFLRAGHDGPVWST